MKTIIKEPDYMGKNKRGFRIFLRFGFLSLIFLLSFIVGNAGIAALGGAIKMMPVAAPGQIIVGEPASSQSVEKSSPDLLEKTVLKRVVQTHPSSFPLDTLLSYMNQHPTPSWEFSAYDTPYLPYTSTVTTSTAAGAAGMRVTLSPLSTEYVRNGSLLFIRSINGNVDSKWLALMVVDIARGANTMDVIALNNSNAGGVQLVPAIPANTKFIIGPISAHELQMQVEPQIPTPQDYSNFNQLFMCQMEIGDYVAAHNKEVGWGWSDIQDYTIMDFRTRRTIAYYLGFAKKAVVDNTVKYTTGGIYRQMSRMWTAPGGSWTDNDFIDFCRYVFVGTKGSQKKIVLAGDELVANISKTPGIHKNQQATATEVVFGLTFTKIKTNFGELLVHYDPLFTEMDMSGHGVVLDPEFLLRTNFDGQHFDNLELKGSGQRRVKAASVAEASAALLRNRDSHVWIKPV